MSQIETTRFGRLEVDEGKIIHMPYGMLGFPDRRRFVLLQHKEGSPFFWYQSLEDPALAFVLTSPFLILADYHVDMKDAFKKMEWKENGDGGKIQLYVVVNIPKGSPERMTANMIGPVLVNVDIREAVQIVVADSSYSHQSAILTPSKS